MTKKKYVLDTSVLLHNPNILKELDGQIIIHSSVLQELEKHKTEKFNARESIRLFKSLNNIEYDIYEIDNIELPTGFDKHQADNKIIACAKRREAILITDDFLMEVKAKSFDIPVENCSKSLKHEDYYKGYKEIYLDTTNAKDNEILAHIYDSPENNLYDLKLGEYLIIYDLSCPIYDKDFEQKLGYKLIDKFRWDGYEYQPTFNKTLKTVMFGNFKPKDVYQCCAIDSLFNNQITMIKGKAGTGKSLIALTYALYMMERNKADKLIIFCNTVGSKNAAKLGFYPGSRTEKLLDSSVGSMLTSKFGDRYVVDTWIQQGKIILLPFGDIRGFDTTGMNAIVWFVEAQNLDIELMRLGIQRIGEDCKVIIDGDYNTQVDSNAYEGLNNGMRRLSEVFRDHDFYGEVELPVIYRSKVAALADKM